METFFKIIGLIFLADFITGFVHFFVDQYGSPETPIVGKFVYEKNARHHEKPREIVGRSYLALTWTSWVLGFVISGILYSLDLFSWEWAFTLAYGANANYIHRWSHQTERENGSFISFLQKIRLVQSRKHHGWHHKAPYDVHYCILTDLLNPILDKTKFWIGFSHLIKIATGLKAKTI